MRKIIYGLLALMALLLGNILAYSLSENYRFLLKKIKYPDEIVYENEEGIDDANNIKITQSGSYKTVEDGKYSFFDSLAGQKNQKEITLPELSKEEKEVLEQLSDYNLEQIAFSTYLFDITGEYPDPYYEWYSKDLTFYAFSTKTYDDLKDIFTVLSYDIPIDIKEINNFGEKSFFINLKNPEVVPQIRIVFQYQNKVFGLKIKKDMYNEIKKLFELFLPSNR